MTLDVQKVLDRYVALLAFGGLAVLLGALSIDLQWLEHPVAAMLLLGAVIGLRAGQIALSKYSYLSQIGLPALVGAVTVGPSPVVFALGLGVFVTDAFWLRKPLFASWINAGREVLAFVTAFGAYAAVLHLSGPPGLTLEFLPAAVALGGIYFFAARSLFYFTLLVRGKLEHDERLMLLRYEILAYILTVSGATICAGAINTLPPEGWLAVLAVLGVLGLL
ncbi:MAG: hypothetical protein ACREMO_06980, partial [Gemmatimonadales bacterium]